MRKKLLKKVKKPAHSFDSYRDVFVADAVVVAKAPYIHESDSSILVLRQTSYDQMRKSIRVSWI